MTGHRPAYRWQRGFRVTVACSCGFESQNHRSPGEARRAFAGHLWLAGGHRPPFTVGRNAHRIDREP